MSEKMTDLEFDKATLKHVKRVRYYMDTLLEILEEKSIRHDESKFNSPEREGFIEYTPKLKGSTYGSEEYKGFLKGLSTSLKHHYEANSHHPEHYINGIRGMDLLDIIEMIADWQAASERHDNGCIFKSVEINQERFGYSDELKEILLNTVKLFNTQIRREKRNDKSL